MQAILSTLEFDPAGFIELEISQSSDAGESRRRMNRTATLDGGAVFNDFGYSASDRTIELKWAPASAAQETAVERMVQLYSQLHVALPAGLFLVAPESYKPRSGESSLSLLVVEKLA